MDSGRFFGDDHLHQRPNEQFKPPQVCWCKGASNLGEVKLVQDFMAHFIPSLEEVVEKALSRKLEPILPVLQQCILFPNSSSLPHQAESSASRRFQLCFKGELPETLLTMDKIEDEGASLEVELLDESGKRVEVGPESCVKIKIDVLDGDFDVEDRDDWTEEDYTKNVARPRKTKGPLLKGNCEIKMTRGAASASHIAFTDNSKSMRNGNFRLGAKVVKGLPPGVVVKEAVSNAFMVKERRQKCGRRPSYTDPIACVKKHRFPSIDDDLWRLVFIRKDGPVYKRAFEAGIRTVNDFLRRCDTTNAKELQRILGVPEAKWKAIVENAKKAKACNLTKETRVKFVGQTSWVYKSVDDSRKEQADELMNAAYPKLSELSKINGLTNQISDQELIDLSIIQGQEQPPSPPPRGNSNVGGHLHTLDARNLLSNQMPTNVCYDAAAVNQAYQDKPVEHGYGYLQTITDTFPLEDDLQLEASSQDTDWDQILTDLLRSSPQLEERGNVSEDSTHGHVTRKFKAACCVTKAATLFMISVQPDESVPKKKRKLQFTP